MIKNFIAGIDANNDGHISKEELEDELEETDDEHEEEEEAEEEE